MLYFIVTCATSRSVRLELSPSMDIESLIKCLKRFICRRGVAKLFISENFSTFRSEDERLLSFLRYNNIDLEIYFTIIPLVGWVLRTIDTYSRIYITKGSWSGTITL